MIRRSLVSFQPHTNAASFTQKVAIVWLFIAAAGVIYRTVQLFFIKDVQTGLAWATKILTDPFHDIKLYHMAPLYLLRGELFDLMTPEHYPARVRRRFRGKR